MLLAVCLQHDEWLNLADFKFAGALFISIRHFINESEDSFYERTVHASY